MLDQLLSRDTRLAPGARERPAPTGNSPWISLNRRRGPVALVLVSVILIVGSLLYTENLARGVRAEAKAHSRLYALVQEALMSTEPAVEKRTLLALQEELASSGVPIIVMDRRGDLVTAANLPFEARLDQPRDRRRIMEYADRLQRDNPTAVSFAGDRMIYIGPPPIIGWLRWTPWLLAAGGLLLLSLAIVLVRTNIRAERDRMWAAMARELAHQMGTPLSSLAGWVELMGLDPEERFELGSQDRVTSEIAADVERLEGVSRRFELIGQPPVLSPLPVAVVLEDMERYIRPRVPRLAAGIGFRLRIAPDLPALRANRVLLAWALENLVKNSLDALAGRGGKILVAAGHGERGWVRIYVADTGPGVAPALRDRLFEPGVSTKVGGWGVGLSLARRIVEEYHGGRISVRPRRRGGTVFEVRLPVPGVRARRSGAHKR